MKKCLERAVKRNVKIIFFARENATQDLSFIKQIGIKLILVKDLHAKLYLNENYAIVTSQNISQYSDTNSIDLGYVTEKSVERKELVDFISKYIGSVEPEKRVIISNDITKQNPNEKIKLSQQQLDFLFKNLKQNFSNSRFVQTDSYIFSSQILGFADLMIDRELTIKIGKNLKDFEQVKRKIEAIKFNHKYRTEIKSAHKSYYYLTLVPIVKLDFNVIANDYVEFINKILKEDI